MIGTAVALIFGLLMVYSASFLYSEERTGDGFFFFRRQLSYAVLGCAALLASIQIPLARYAKLAPILLGSTIALLACVWIPGIGARVGGATRWIGLGPVRFQPAELAKLICILFFAKALAVRMRSKSAPAVAYLSPLLFVAPVFGLLLLQPDFGSTAIIAMTLAVLVFVAGIPWKWVVGLGLTLCAAASLLIFRSPYRRDRVLTFLDPWADPQGGGFQVIQSMLGLHNGGFIGSGLGNGKEKLFFLPEAHNDFILAVIGEELGFVGVLGVLFFFVWFITKGFRIAWVALEKRGDAFSFLVGCGIAVWIGLQGFINMGVVLGLLPTKGLTLPLISYGGSSLIIDLWAIGILFRVSVENRSAQR